MFSHGQLVYHLVVHWRHLSWSHPPRTRTHAFCDQGFFLISQWRSSFCPPDVYKFVVLASISSESTCFLFFLKFTLANTIMVLDRRYSIFFIALLIKNVDLTHYWFYEGYLNFLPCSTSFDVKFSSTCIPQSSWNQTYSCKIPFSSYWGIGAEVLELWIITLSFSEWIDSGESGCKIFACYLLWFQMGILMSH